MGRVLFDDISESEDLTVYNEDLNDIFWRNRLVGLTTSGFLYASEKIPRKGKYEFRPKLIDWVRINEVKIGKHIHFPGIIFGLFALFIAFCAFVAGWVRQDHVGPGIVTIPILFGIGGFMMIFGCVRNRIIVVTADGSYRWISAPLTYQKTLSICTEATDRCRAQGVFLTSHVEPGA